MVTAFTSGTRAFPSLAGVYLTPIESRGGGYPWDS
jgi:hypothetical protein